MKQKSPLSIEIIPGAYGWADVRLKIFDDVFEFALSDVCDSIHGLIERVYYLYPVWQHDNRDHSIMEYGEADITSTINGTKETERWYDIPYASKPLYWDGEGSYVIWKMKRPLDIKSDFEVTIILEVNQEDVSTHTYAIRYSDLCYALAKGVTEMLLDYGFIGYYETTWMEDINLRHFLRIKEIALDTPIALTDGEHEGVFHTSLKQELDLLLHPM